MTPTMYDPALDPRFQQQQDPRIVSAPPPPPQPQGVNPLMAAAMGLGVLGAGAMALRGRRGVTVTNLPRQAPAPRPVPAPRVEVPVQAPRNIPIDFVEPAPRPAPAARGMNTSPTRDLSQTPAPRVVSSAPPTPKQVAFIGSRDLGQIPSEALGMYQQAAREAASRGHYISTGAAQGADQLAAEAYLAAGGQRVNLHLPWDGYEKPWIDGLRTKYGDRVAVNAAPLSKEALDSIALHPNAANLSQGVQKLMGRNYNIVADANSVVAIPRPPEQGGTAHGIAIARSRNIPVFNLAVDEGRQAFSPYLRTQSAGGVTAETFTPAEVEQMFNVPSRMPSEPTLIRSIDQAPPGMGGKTFTPGQGPYYPEVKTTWTKNGAAPNFVAERRAPGAGDLVDLRRSLDDFETSQQYGLSGSKFSNAVGDVMIDRSTGRPMSADDIMRQPTPEIGTQPQRWVDSSDAMRSLGQREMLVREQPVMADIEHGFRGHTDWRQAEALKNSMPASEGLSFAPQLSRSTPVNSREVDLFREGDAVSPYANEVTGVRSKPGSFNIVTDATEKGDGNWLKASNVEVPGVGTFPLTRSATVEVGGQTFSRNPGDYFDMDAQDAIEFKRSQAKSAATKFLTGMDSPTVSPTQSLENQKAYEIHRQGLTSAERDYASAYRQMEMPEQVTYKGRVSLPAGQSDPVKQYLQSKGLEVDAVTLPRDPDQTHVTFRGSSDVPTQLEVQRVLSKGADREVMKLPPGYSIAPENVHGFEKSHPGAVPGQLYKGVEWSTDEKGKQFISKAGEPVMNDRGKPEVWQGQPVEVDASVERPTVKAVPSAYQQPVDSDPELFGMRDKWKQEREDYYAAKLGRELPADPIARAAVQASNEMSLRERAQALVARRQGRV